jgi:hypothetical protein
MSEEIKYNSEYGRFIAEELMPHDSAVKASVISNARKDIGTKGSRDLEEALEQFYAHFSQYGSEKYPHPMKQFGGIDEDRINALKSDVSRSVFKGAALESLVATVIGIVVGIIVAQSSGDTVATAEAIQAGAMQAEAVKTEMTEIIKPMFLGGGIALTGVLAAKLAELGLAMSAIRSACVRVNEKLRSIAGNAKAGQLRRADNSAVVDSAVIK